MTLTLQQLEANPMRKKDAIRLLGLKIFDYALPEPWLVEFYKKTGLDRWLVLSSRHEESVRRTSVNLNGSAKRNHCAWLAAMTPRYQSIERTL